VICHAGDRRTALESLSAALEYGSLTGVANNLPFLARLSRQADVVAGNVSTGLIASRLEALAIDPAPTSRLMALAAVHVAGVLEPRNARDPWSRLVGWRAWGVAEVPVDLMSGDRQLATVSTSRMPWRRSRMTVAGPVVIDRSRWDDGILFADGEACRPHFGETGGELDVHLTNGEQARFGRPQHGGSGMEASAGRDRVLSPMPGVVKLVTVKPGERVAKGQRLAVVEAMKTEYALDAPRDGTVAKVAVAAGATVALGALLVELEAPSDG